MVSALLVLLVLLLPALGRNGLPHDMAGPALFLCSRTLLASLLAFLLHAMPVIAAAYARVARRGSFY